MLLVLRSRAPARALLLALVVSCAHGPSTPAALAPPPPFRERPVQIARANGLELAWDSFGDERAPPILLIMGLGLPMIAWDDRFCSQLASHGFRVIRFDNRDAGLSTHFDGAGDPNLLHVWNELQHRRRPASAYQLTDMANDAVALLDALGIERAHVVGLSMGGMIAQIIAIEHPGRVRTLTSIMSNSSDPAVRGPSFETVLSLMRPIPPGREAFVERGVAVARILAGGGFPVDVDFVRSLAARTFDREQGRAHDPHQPSAPSDGGVHRQAVAVLTAASRRDALGRLDLPALVIHGAADPLIPVDGGRATARAIRNARLTIIDGMGHELPRAVWDRVIADIAELAHKG